MRRFYVFSLFALSFLFLDVSIGAAELGKASAKWGMRPLKWNVFPKGGSLEKSDRFDKTFKINFVSSYKRRSRLDKHVMDLLEKFGDLSWVRNWYLPIHNWGTFAKYGEMEFARAEERKSGFLLGAFHRFGENRKLGLAYHYSDLSSDLMSLGDVEQGWFLNFIVKY